MQQLWRTCTRLFTTTSSPSNILHFQSDGAFKLADFGIIDRLHATLGNTNTSIRGTSLYMAPEQYQEGGRTSDKSDTWGLATTLLHAWTGKLPYAASRDRFQVHESLANGAVPYELKTLNRSLPPGVNSILQHCLNHNADGRPSAAEVHLQLLSARMKVQVRDLMVSRACSPVVGMLNA